MSKDWRAMESKELEALLGWFDTLSEEEKEKVRVVMSEKQKELAQKNMKDIVEFLQS